MPEGLVPAYLRDRLAEDSCGPALLCVPKALAEDRSSVAASCRAIGDLEGRCVPACLPDVAAQADLLDAGSCAPGEMCAPCFDPRTGEDTGVCHIGGDPGPREFARVFAPCCDGRAQCVPASLAARFVAPEDRERLGRGSCAGAEDTCVPSDWIDDTGRLAHCRALDDFEGRCVLDCLPDVVEQSDSLSRDSCGRGELCAPCFDPLSGEDTTLCRRGNDKPREPAKSFGSCCELAGSAHGRCVPADLLQSKVSAADSARLGSDQCGAAQRCVPATWLENPPPAPAECRALGNLEGRCLSRCLPEIEARAGELDASSCSNAELCVPCFDPLSGEDTGACRSGEDQPKETARTFSSCCDWEGEGRGRCVPRAFLTAQVAASDLEQLGTDVCESESDRCVPAVWLEDLAATPARCQAIGGFEGRCLPRCLPDVSARTGELDSSSCESAELCVPCFDPISGSDTGACRTRADRPRAPAETFPACCGEGPTARGRCLPKTLLADRISASDLSRFGPDICSDPASTCVPATWIDAPAIELQTCRALGAYEGRCMSTCLPDVARRLETLERDSCDESERCVPCFDLRSQAETGACNIGGDQPVDPVPTLPSCCGGSGRCLPGAVLSQVVEAEDLRWLGADSCREADARCVPEAWLQDPPAAPRACRALGNLEGRCLSSCLPEIESMSARLVRDSCSARELCAPCHNPQTLEPTGACETGTDRPREAPRGFATCCGRGQSALGTCVPVELLSEDQLTLARDSCTSYDARCVPSQLLSSPARPVDGCDTTLSGPGLCFDACFLADLSSTARSVLSTCGSNGRCVPCTSVSMPGPGCE